MDLTITDYFGYPLPPQERMRLIKAAGFKGISGLIWRDDFDIDYNLFPEYAANMGLYIENMHAPWQDCNDIWLDKIDGQVFMEEIIELVKVCARYEIPALVLHPENKNGTAYAELPVNFSIGIDRFKRIIAVAEHQNVNIAIENMCRIEYLDCIFSSITSKRLGFCFDSGHWNVFLPDIDLLGLYGNRLMALHLHDNNGKDDWHALPFSGNIDWDKIKLKLKAVKYNGAISLEVGNKTFEHIQNPNEFLMLAAESARGIVYTK